MPINYFIARNNNGTRWKNRIADLVDEILDDQKYDDLVVAGRISRDEKHRLYNVLAAFTLHTGRDFNTLRTSGLTPEKALWETSVRMGKALIASRWTEVVDAYYFANPDKSQPEKERTTKILGRVGSAVVKLLIKEQA